MLSTPTPARPTICSCGAWSSSAAVTFVSLRTRSAVAVARSALRSSGPFGVRTSQRSRSNASPSGASGSATTTMGLGWLAAAGDGIGGLAPSGAAGRAGRRRGRLGVRAQDRGDRLARLDRLVEVLERRLERAEEGDHVLERDEAHVPDARDLPFDASLPARDDGVVVIAQDPDEVARVDPRGHPERGDARRGVALVAEDAEAQRLEAAARRVREVAVTLEDRGLALFGHEPQRLLQPDEHADRR